MLLVRRCPEQQLLAVKFLGDGGDIGVVHFEVQGSEVSFLVFSARAARQDCIAAAKTPIEHDLDGCAAVLTGELNDERVFHDACSAMNWVVHAANRTVSHGHDTYIVEVANEVYLGVRRQDLYLVACWFDSAVGEHISQQLYVEV